MANEKRLIDANAVLAEIQKLREVPTKVTSFTALNVIASIKNAPTVDAVEVVHGEWRVTDTIPTIEKQVMCSSCRCIWYYPKARWSDIHLHNYCPNCGAKMDGDGNG